ncbi:hypothetical protein [Methanoculleus sp.]|jgi:DNA-binding IclR family transcriptional regulator|uniref:hypothetical protein n=1 Tax=Methanoculleus sp. TaxID=90427 RepID=UPI0025D15491|nr:hypothetical protein [Methanoculleus sp.]MCK9319598.1 hypothetical protein [Methanoculleus sp.]
MHREDKFKKFLYKLAQQGRNKFTTTEIIVALQDELKVTSQTASRYLQEMVSWKLLEQDGFTFTNVYYKKVV